MKLLTTSLLVLSLSGIGASAQTDTDTVKVNLGTADKFGLLGGSGITNVSAHTFIIGDGGSSPTPTVKGVKPAQVKGELYLKSSPVTAAAQRGLTTAYNQAASAHCGTTLTGVNLGGMKLIPGVYCFATAAQLTGTLKLDAQGNSNAQWIFQMGTTLTTAPNFKVVVHLGGKGGRGCNVVLAGRFLGDGREGQHFRREHSGAYQRHAERRRLSRQGSGPQRCDLGFCPGDGGWSALCCSWRRGW
jgi:hypothetical protein